mgnify:CR=1 FL=1|nr:MAG TPA: Flagellar and Swarming motility protein [Caudoviricetes sp.]
MAKFIEVHYNGIPYMLNFDMIISIVPGENKKTELFQRDSSERFICDETYKEVMEKLGIKA